MERADKWILAVVLLAQFCIQTIPDARRAGSVLVLGLGLGLRPASLQPAASIITSIQQQPGAWQQQPGIIPPRGGAPGMWNVTSTQCNQCSIGYWQYVIQKILHRR